ncbi:MAG: hypothetical protein JWO32_2173 [Bacteroidetes bacterium]|nr:hypothetical protein [Bacteroidota bacterium]
MKTKFFKAAHILVGFLLMTVSTANASIGEKFNKYVGNEFTNFQGLYIIGGIVVASLVMYFIVNHLQKEEEHGVAHHGSHFSRHKRHVHHHASRIIKKTS